MPMHVGLSPVAIRISCNQCFCSSSIIAHDFVQRGLQLLNVEVLNMEGQVLHRIFIKIVLLHECVESLRVAGFADHGTQLHPSLHDIEALVLVETLQKLLAARHLVVRTGLGHFLLGIPPVANKVDHIWLTCGAWQLEVLGQVSELLLVEAPGLAELHLQLQIVVFVGICDFSEESLQCGQIRSV